MGNNINGNFIVWPLMDDELAPPEPPQHRSALEDDTLISYGGGEYTFGLTLAQQKEEESLPFEDDTIDEQSEHFSIEAKGDFLNQETEKEAKQQLLEEQILLQADDENESIDQAKYLAQNLDEIIPKYLLMQLEQIKELNLEEEHHKSSSSSSSSSSHQSAHLQQKSKDEHLLNLIEVNHDASSLYGEEQFFNNFDLVDFLDDVEWPFDFADENLPRLHKADQEKQHSAEPLDDELIQIVNQ